MITPLDLSEFYVVVRSVGERTTGICHDLLESYFKESVEVISVRPFSEAIKISFEKGLASQKKWLLCIDADVLISYDGLSGLLNKCGEVPPEVFEIQGLILDKFFPIYRPAGNHLYRLDYCSTAVDLISDCLRPETEMLNQMALKGYPWLQCDSVVGVHDFEQYYNDIYDKAYLQAIKHTNLTNDVERYWVDNASDLDYKVALWGVLAGRNSNGKTSIDKSIIQEASRKDLGIEWIDEKEKMEITIQPKTILEEYDSEKFATLQDKYFPKERWNRLTDSNLLLRKNNKPSLLSRIFWKLGFLFEKVSKFSYRISSMLVG